MSVQPPTSSANTAKSYQVDAKEQKQIQTTLQQASQGKSWGSTFQAGLSKSDFSKHLTQDGSLSSSSGSSDPFAGLSPSDAAQAKEAIYSALQSLPSGLAAETWNALQPASASVANASPSPSTAPFSALTESTTSSSGTSAASSAQAVGAAATKDGYTVAQVKNDITSLAAQNPSQGAAPQEPVLTQLAQGIVDGINANFSGPNLIGDFSQVSGATMAKNLAASAWSESRCKPNGLDGGGIFQTAQVRLDTYNQAHGTSLSQADLQSSVPLAAKVATWAMANPIGIVGLPASSANPIPSSLSAQTLYYWNYNCNPAHGHPNELTEYMSERDRLVGQLGAS